mmetsp:Transcript_5928/g.17067  ORF Transcript_5928/g.17067 Transcript_5928/m.17067 type:complete len:1784 (-) Transcript_5928:255-5606(-)
MTQPAESTAGRNQGQMPPPFDFVKSTRNKASSAKAAAAASSPSVSKPSGGGQQPFQTPEQPVRPHIVRNASGTSTDSPPPAPVKVDESAVDTPATGDLTQLSTPSGGANNSTISTPPSSASAMTNATMTPGADIDSGGNPFDVDGGDGNPFDKLVSMNSISASATAAAQAAEEAAAAASALATDLEDRSRGDPFASFLSSDMESVSVIDDEYSLTSVSESSAVSGRYAKGRMSPYTPGSAYSGGYAAADRSTGLNGLGVLPSVPHSPARDSEAGSSRSSQDPPGDTSYADSDDGGGCNVGELLLMPPPSPSSLSTAAQFPSQAAPYSSRYIQQGASPSSSVGSHNRAPSEVSATPSDISGMTAATPIMGNVSIRKTIMSDSRDASLAGLGQSAGPGMDQGVPSYAVGGDDNYIDEDLEMASDYRSNRRGTRSRLVGADPPERVVPINAPANTTSGRRSYSSSHYSSAVNMTMMSDGAASEVTAPISNLSSNRNGGRANGRIRSDGNLNQSNDEKQWISKQKVDIRASNGDVAPLGSEDSMNQSFDTRSRDERTNATGPPRGLFGFALTMTEKWLCVGMALLLGLGVAGIVVGTIGFDDGGGTPTAQGSSVIGTASETVTTEEPLPEKFIYTWNTDEGYPTAPSYAAQAQLSYNVYTVKVLSQCLEICQVDDAIAGIFLLDEDVDNCRCNLGFECMVTGEPKIESGLVFSKMGMGRRDTCDGEYCKYFGYLDEKCDAVLDAGAKEDKDETATTTVTTTTITEATSAGTTTSSAGTYSNTTTTIGTVAEEITNATAAATDPTTDVIATTTETVPTLSPTPNPTKAPSTDPCDSTLCAWTSADGLSNIAGENFGDFSGTAVSLSDDGLTLAVGEIGYFGGRGRVRIFTRTEIPSDDAGADEGDGDGTGGTGDNMGGGMRQLDSTQWTPLGGLSPDYADGIPGQGSDEQFGISVALSADGRTVAAGGDGASWGYGVVRVYSYDGTKWTPRGSAVVGGAPNDKMGKYVDLSHDGNTLAVAAPSGIGYSRVYKWDGTDYAEHGELFSTGPIRSLALAAKHDTLAVGSSEGGFVEVYHYVQSSSQWKPRGVRIEGATNSSDFGATVALSSDGHMLAVGAPKDESAGTKSGSATLYHWHEGSWTMVGDSIGGNLHDHAGDALALSNDGTTLAVGSPGPKDRYSQIRTYHIAPSASITGSSSPPFEWKEEGSMTGLSAALASGTSSRPFLSVALSGDGKFMAAGHANANVNGATLFYEEEVVPTAKPTLAPTMNPTDTPTMAPTMTPTMAPTTVPTTDQGESPTPPPVSGTTTTTSTTKGTLAPPKWGVVTAAPPTPLPTLTPTNSPTLAPTLNPTNPDTSAPTIKLTLSPHPTPIPTQVPTSSPTKAPVPTNPPTLAPTPDPCAGGKCSWKPVSGAAWNGDGDDEKFGTSTALSADGSTLVVGARGSQSPGYVKTYRKNAAGAWKILGQKFAGSFPFDRFGISVDVSANGQRIVIGADGFDEGGMNTGVVRMYELNAAGKRWTSMGELVGDSAYDQAGWTVAISGDGNVVAYGASELYTRSYKWDGTKWSEWGTQMGFSTRSGRTLKLSYDGMTMAIGQTSNSGVRVYRMIGNRWATKGTSNILRGPGDSGAGSAVALSSDGNTVAFGGPLYTFNKGMVRSYSYNGKSWDQIGSDDLVGKGTWDTSHFGTAIALSEDGTIMAVGTPGVNGGDDDDDGPWLVTMYQRSSSDTPGWTAMGDEIAGDEYAHGVSRSEPNLSLSLNGKGNLLAVGSSLNGEAGANRGKVTMYRYD